MLEHISSTKLLEWMAYYELEPFGEFQQEYRAGLVASTMANTVRDDKKRKEPFKADEFMRSSYLDKPEAEEENSDLAVWEKIKAVFGAFGAKKKGK